MSQQIIDELGDVSDGDLAVAVNVGCRILVGCALKEQVDEFGDVRDGGLAVAVNVANYKGLFKPYNVRELFPYGVLPSPSTSPTTKVSSNPTMFGNSFHTAAVL